MTPAYDIAMNGDVRPQLADPEVDKIFIDDFRDAFQVCIPPTRADFPLTIPTAPVSVVWARGHSIRLETAILIFKSQTSESEASG